MANQSFNFPATNPLWDGYSEYLPETFPNAKGYLHPLQQNSDLRYVFGDSNSSYFRSVDTYNDANLNRILETFPEGNPVNDKLRHMFRSPLSDIYSTGAIRGTDSYQRGAFFNEIFPEVSYRSSAVTSGVPRHYNPETAAFYDHLMTTRNPENPWADLPYDDSSELKYNRNFMKGAAEKAKFYFPEHKNLFIEASPEFIANINAGNNPLYGAAVKQGSSYISLNIPRAVDRMSLSEIGTKSTAEMFQPTEPTFLQRINPANRKGLKITQTDPVNIVGVDNPNYYMHDQIYVESGKGDPSKLGPEWQVSKTQNGTRVYRFIGNHNGSLLVPDELTRARTTLEPPNAKVLYDRITPAGERSIPQHARNAVFEAKVFLNQPEVRYAADVVKGAGKIGLNAAGLVGYAGAIAEKGPLAAVEWGVPLTRMRMGIGPILTADAPTLDIAREREERNLELRKQKALILGEPNSIHPAFNRTYNEPLDLPSADEDMRKILGL